MELSQRKLAEKLGVSAMAVTRAIKKLKAEGHSEFSSSSEYGCGKTNLLSEAQQEAVRDALNKPVAPPKTEVIEAELVDDMQLNALVPWQAPQDIEVSESDLVVFDAAISEFSGLSPAMRALIEGCAPAGKQLGAAMAVTTISNAVQEKQRVEAELLKNLGYERGLS